MAARKKAGGRPSKAELEERDRRKKAWLLEQDHRRQVESHIKQAGARRPSGERPPSPFSPAMQFVIDRLNGIPAEQISEAQVMIDLLLRNDIALDKVSRGFIAAALWRLAYPAKAKQSALRAKVKSAKHMLAEFDRRGEKPDEARDQVAKMLGHTDGDALRKWLESHKRLLDD